MTAEEQCPGAESTGCDLAGDHGSPVAAPVPKTAEGHTDADSTFSSDPVGAPSACWSESLQPDVRYTRFGLTRRSPTAPKDWYQRHWLGLMLLAQLGLTVVFVVFATTYGFGRTTIFFAVLAGYNLVVLVVGLVFAANAKSANGVT